MPRPRLQYDNLAIVSGTGVLPRLLADQAREQNKNYCLVTLQGMDLPWVQDHPRIEFCLERIAPAFDQLRKRQIDNMVLAGGMQRPERISPWRFDLRTAAIAARLLRGMARGDDAALRTFLNVIEQNGFQILSAQQLMPDLLAQSGILTRVKPNKQDRFDAKFAVDLLNSLSPFDLGQGCVIAKRRCLSVESHYGTDTMLEFVAKHHAQNTQKRSGVLVKMPKIGQDLRADLPALGVDTVHNVANAGLAGIAVPALNVLMIEREKVIAAADDVGIFIYSMPEDPA